MDDSQKNSRSQTQAGFALITSLIFLVVVTLLALSSMRSVSLQEKMASNLHEKGRAFNAANTSLRGSEYDISQWGDNKPVGDTDPPPPADDGTSRVWKLNGTTSGQPTDFALDTVWANAWSYTQFPYNTISNNGLADKPKAFIEQECHTLLTGGNLNPVTASDPNSAVVFDYRVTGRGNGGNKSAVAVVQSVYAHPYYQTSAAMTDSKVCDASG